MGSSWGRGGNGGGRGGLRARNSVNSLGSGVVDSQVLAHFPVSLCAAKLNALQLPC